MDNRYSEEEKTVKMERPEVSARIITKDKKMLAIFQYIESVARTSQPILITGETGVGKDLIARTIHIKSNLKGYFVAVNIAGLDDNMFSDTLFGHIKGAFTGAGQSRGGQIEKARGGTLFLDEIGDLTRASQVKLLRLLQEGEYLPLGQDELKKANVRIVAATNEDLWLLQRAGKFRKDLNFRLRAHHINIPPLRERKDDIPLLVDFFLTEAANALNKKKPTPPKELFALLGAYSFPGNVRELQTMIFDAVSRHKTKILSLETFKFYIAQEQENGIIPISSNPEDASLFTFFKMLPSIKKASQMLVEEAMRRAKGNQSVASRMLGISQQALSKRLKKEKSDLKYPQL